MNDENAIRATVLDYVEGWYEGNRARMDRALHPDLAKRRLTPEGELWPASKDLMLELTEKGQGKIDDPAAGKKELTILDRTAAMASVKLVSEKFVDYIHLAKANGEWKVMNALWDNV